MAVNRYCASGLESIAIASAKIRTGMADVIIAGGAESMSLIPMGGWRIVPNSDIAMIHPDWYWGMGRLLRQLPMNLMFLAKTRMHLDYAHIPMLLQLSKQENLKMKLYLLQ